MKNNKKPERKCVACGEHKEKKELIRVVKNADGNVFIDETGKANGRGAYVCNDAKCIEKALKTGKLSRTLKTDIPKGILDDYGKQ
mgnify:CR=1 FL=1